MITIQHSEVGNLFCCPCVVKCKEVERTASVLFTRKSQITGLTETSGLTDAGAVEAVVASQEAEVVSQGGGAPCRCPQDPPQPC